MQTIKTGIVVALLLAVCYGAFVALNAPEPDLPPSIDEWIAQTDEFQGLVGFENEPMASMESAMPVSPADFLNEMANEDPAPASIPDLGVAIDNAGGTSSDFPSLPGTEVPALGMDLPNLDPTADDMQSGGLTQSLPTGPGGGVANVPESPSLSGFPALDTGGDAPSLSMPVSEDSPTKPTEPALGQFPNLPVKSDSSSQLANDAPSQDLIPPMLDTTAAAIAPYEPGGSVEPMDGGAAYASTYDRSQASPESGLALPAADFATARAQALQVAENGQLGEALRMLTPYFGSPELKYDQASDLIDILDGLAKEVLYSKRHLLEPAYVVKQIDTVESVASAHGLTPEFLAAINGLGDSKALVAGETLKVLKGPFRARVDLGQSEMTLFLGDLYAGRFPISTGQEPRPKAGMFEVVDRQTKRTYYGNSSNVLKHSDPRNPYGGYWIDIGEGLCIHGSAEMLSEDLANAGCISLAPIDARDIYNILINGSQVQIVE